MSIFLDAQEQERVDQLRIDLAQTVIDLAEVQTHDFYSHQAKERSIESLNRVKANLDGLGLLHTNRKRLSDGRS